MSDVDRVEAAEIPLKCQHCGGDRFHERGATLPNSSLLGSLLNIEGLFSHRMAVYICRRCGFAHFFASVDDDDSKDPVRKPMEAVETDPIDCLACRQQIPPGITKCPTCGWSWKLSDQDN